MNDDVTVVRIYIKESDHGRKRSLMEELLNILRRSTPGPRRCRVSRDCRFWKQGCRHSADLLRLTVDLPLVVEFYDKPEVVDAALALISDIVPAGHIVHWRALVAACAGVVVVAFPSVCPDGRDGDVHQTARRLLADQ